MIDSINPISNKQSGPLARTQSVRQGGKQPSATYEKKNVNKDVFVVQKMAAKDVLSVSFNLKEDVKQLSQSVSVAYEEVKSQLEEYFGVSRDENSEDLKLAKDSSMEEWVEFFRPENTANRIVNFATGFFDAYQANHAEQEDEETVVGFTSLLGKAVQKGFEEAEKILGDFDKLGEIGENIKRTYHLVMKGLEEYRRENLNDLGLLPEKPETVPEEVLQEEPEIEE